MYVNLKVCGDAIKSTILLSQIVCIVFETRVLRAVLHTQVPVACT